MAGKNKTPLYDVLAKQYDNNPGGLSRARVAQLLGIDQSGVGSVQPGSSYTAGLRRWPSTIRSSTTVGVTTTTGCGRASLSVGSR